MVANGLYPNTQSAWLVHPKWLHMALTKIPKVVANDLIVQNAQRFANGFCYQNSQSGWKRHVPKCPKWLQMASTKMHKMEMAYPKCHSGYKMASTKMHQTEMAYPKCQNGCKEGVYFLPSRNFNKTIEFSQFFVCMHVGIHQVWIGLLFSVTNSNIIPYL